MLSSVGPAELIVVLIVGVLLLGDRLPEVARDAARLLRRLRGMATDATEGLREEMPDLPKDFNPRDYHPRNLIQKHIIDAAFADEDEEPVSLAKPAWPSASVPAARTSAPAEAASARQPVDVAARYSDDVT